MEMKSKKIYTPYVITADFNDLGKVLKDKEAVVVVTNEEFFEAFEKYIQGTIKTKKSAKKGDKKLLAAVGFGAASAVVWPLGIPAAVALVGSLVNYSDSAFNAILDRCLVNLRHYYPLFDTIHRYVFLFNMERNGYIDGCRVDTTKIYSDTSEKVELRDPITGEIRISNVNEICANDHIKG